MHVKDLIDYQECSERLSALFPLDCESLDTAILKYFQAGSSWEEDVVYTQAQAQKFVEDLLIQFVSEQCNCTRFDAKTAIDLQMPISSSVSSIYPAGEWL
jgi:hypothetical protein